MSLHQNNGKCPGCVQIVDRYPNFHSGLRLWFFGTQRIHPEMHTSCAGRGRLDQEACFHKGASRAHYGQSSHNYNAALDLFREAPTVNEMYDKGWFTKVVGNEVILARPLYGLELIWYGAPGSAFYELPHVEVNHWNLLAKAGDLKLVE